MHNLVSVVFLGVTEGAYLEADGAGAPSLHQPGRSLHHIAPIVESFLAAGLLSAAPKGAC